MTKSQLYYVDLLLKLNKKNDKAIYYITKDFGIIATGAMYLKFYENLDGIIESNTENFDFKSLENDIYERFAEKAISFNDVNMDDYTKYYINSHNAKIKDNCFDRKLYKLFYKLMTKRAKFMLCKKELVVPSGMNKEQEILFAKSKKAEGMLLPLWKVLDGDDNNER